MVDIELIQMAKNNNKNAFKIIFNTYRQKVARTAYLILRDHQYAEDIVQDAFLQVFQKINKLSDPLSFESWLYRITVNLCFEVLRKQKRSSLQPLDEYTDLNTEVKLTDYNTPEDFAIKKEQQTNTLKCIHSLPVQLKIVLILFYYNNFSIREIAAIADCSESAVKSRLFRARKSLESIFNELQIKEIDIHKGSALYEYR